MGTIEVRETGVYRVDVDPQNGLRLQVFQGFVNFHGAAGETLRVETDQELTMRSRESSPKVSVSAYGDDQFDKWNYDRQSYLGEESASRYNVPEEISAYSRDLDEHGEWTYSFEFHRYVWVPYVEDGWRPYSRGRWVWYPRGYSWVSSEPWGWAPYHYGRWNFSIGIGWCWIPGFHYSPAWVSWYVGTGYLGWCAVGY